MRKSTFVTIIAVIVAFLSVAIAVAGSYVQTLFADATAQLVVLREGYESLVAVAPFLGEVLPAVGGFVALLVGLWFVWMLVCPNFRR